MASRFSRLVTVQLDNILLFLIAPALPFVFRPDRLIFGSGLLRKGHFNEFVEVGTIRRTESSIPQRWAARSPLQGAAGLRAALIASGLSSPWSIYRSSNR